MVNLDDVSVFIAVVEKQNFSAAARELKISPSAVSKRINRLEHQLRAKLINRSSRRIALSAAGSAFFEKCVGIRPIVLEATRAVQSLHSAPGGKLRVHASMGLGIKLITPLIPDFLTQFPNISVDLITHVHGPAVLANDVDIFINTAETLDKTLGSRDLGVCHYAICATPDYLRQHGTPATPRDLEKHNCLLYNDYGQLMDRWPFKLKGGIDEVKVSGAFVSNNSAVLYETLIKGYGIALLPVYTVIDDVKSNRVVTLFGDQLMFERKLSAYYPRSPHLPINVRLFLDFVSSHLRGLELDTRRVAAS
jgi:DNA-binding transcriptional LysR family regulator